MPQVITRKAEYDETLARLIPELIETVAPGRITPGSRVLIKPNFLVAARPDQAILTHPFIVRAAARHVLDRGGRLLIADSPGYGSFDRILRTGGFEAALSGMDVEIRPFSESVTVDIGEPFGKIDLAREAIEADLVINLPKLKTHSQMGLTLAVKNLFGTVVGWRKPEWHLKAGVDRAMFARLLVGICRAVRPEITILDGILALEGHGPGKRGKPRHIGVLLAGDDPFAIDLAVCKMVGLPPEQLPTSAEALKTGADGPNYTIDGRLPVIKNFRIPEPGSLTFGPKFMQGIIRKHLVQRPVADTDLCRLCGHCAKYCPASAIACSEAGIAFDYDRCIRCYCCIEICPHGAMTAADTRLGRGAKWLFG